MKNINDKLPEIEVQEKSVAYPVQPTIFLNILYCITAVTNPVENMIKKTKDMEERMSSKVGEYIDRTHLSKSALKRKYGSEVLPLKNTIKEVYKKAYSNIAQYF